MLQKPGDDTSWYVLEQSGSIYRIDGAHRKTLLLNLKQFYDISSCNECGLLGMAFHPDFAINGFIYLSFTEGSGSALTSYIARFRSSDGGLSFAFDSGLPDRANILQIAQPHSNHNGGHIAFGPDGFLYYGVHQMTPWGHGQNTSTLLGGMLRLRDDGRVRFRGLRLGADRGTISAGRRRIRTPTAADKRAEYFLFCRGSGRRVYT